MAKIRQYGQTVVNYRFDEKNLIKVNDLIFTELSERYGRRIVSTDTFRNGQFIYLFIYHTVGGTNNGNFEDFPDYVFYP